MAEGPTGSASLSESLHSLSIGDRDRRLEEAEEERLELGARRCPSWSDPESPPRLGSLRLRHTHGGDEERRGVGVGLLAVLCGPGVTLVRAAGGPIPGSPCLSLAPASIVRVAVPGPLLPP